MNGQLDQSSYLRVSVRTVVQSFMVVESKLNFRGTHVVSNPSVKGSIEGMGMGGADVGVVIPLSCIIHHI